MRPQDLASQTVAAAPSLFARLMRAQAAIRRELREIEGGVEAVTTSPNAEIVALIQEHGREMQRRWLAGAGAPAGLAARAGQGVMEVEMLPQGVRVTERSELPEVVELIRAHAQILSGFLAAGGAAGAAGAGAGAEGFAGRG